MTASLVWPWLVKLLAGLSLKAAAEKQQHERDQSRADADQASAHGSRMGSVVALYQVSIALGSVCLLTKKRSLWYLSLLLGLLSTLLMIQVFAV